MKTEPKPFASLSSGLLARKGAARPAMRPQGFGQLGSGLEDLGWNDMGFVPPKPASNPDPDAEHDAFGEVIPAHPHNLAGLTPVDSPVHDQQAALAGRLSSFSPDDAGDDEIDDTAEPYDPDAEENAEEEQPEAAIEEEAVIDEVVEDVVEDVAAIEDLVEEAPAFAAPEPIQAVAPQPAVRRQPRPRAAAGSKSKAAFTLRLDPDRHLKLRLACAVDGRSAQMLVTEALDKLLADMPELDSMAVKAKRKG